MPIPSVYDIALEQERINQAQQDIMNEYIPEDDAYTDMLLKQNSIDPNVINQRAAEEKAQLLQQLNASQDTEESLIEQAEKRIDAIVAKGNPDKNVILADVMSDPVLQQVAATDVQKLKLVDRISSEVASNNDPYAGLAGKTITGSEGALETGLNAAWEALKSSISSPYYDYRKYNAIKKLDDLPSKELARIQRKLDLARDVNERLSQANHKLFTGSPEEQVVALREREYLSNELNKLNLNAEDKALWDQYGASYINAKTELAAAQIDQSNFTGANEISLEEAESIVNNAKRDQRYKALGEEASYLNPEYAFEAIKDNFNAHALAKNIGEVAGSAALMLLPGPLGKMGMAYSFGSDFTSHFVDILADYIEKHGDVPSDAELTAAVSALGSATADFFGRRMLVKGITTTGLIKDMEKRLKESFISAKALKGVDPRAAASTVLAKLRMSHLPATDADYGKIISSAIDDVNKIATGAKKSVAQKAKDYITKPFEGGKKVNTFAHQVAGIGVQDLAKSGTGLAFENAMSTLANQWGKGEYDTNALIESAFKGLVGGAGFHAVAGGVGATAGYIKEKVKELRNSTNTRIDSREEFNASLNAIKDKDNAEYRDEIISAYKDHYENTRDAIEKTVDKAKQKIFDKLGEENFTEQDGVWTYNPPADASKVKIAKGMLAAKSLTKLDAEAAKKLNTIDTYLSELDNVGIEETKKDYAENPTDERKRAKALEVMSEEEKKKDLIEKDFLTEADAEAALKFDPSAVNKDDSFTKAMSKLGETNLALYGDINRDTAIKQALINGDKTAFDAAVDAATNIENARKSYLKSKFDEAKFDMLNRTNTININEKGIKDNGEEATYSEYSKAAQRDADTKFNLDRKNPTASADLATALQAHPNKATLTNPTDLVGNISARTLEQRDIDQNIRKEFFGNKSIEEAKQNVAQAIKTAIPGMSESDIVTLVNNYAKEARQALQEANKLNKVLEGKTLYKNKAEVTAAYNKAKKYAETHGKMYAAEIRSTPNGHYYIHNVIDDISEEKKEELDKLVKDPKATLNDMIKWYESVKGTYSKIQYKGDPFTKFFDKNILPKINKPNLKSEEQEKYKQKLYKTLTDTEVFSAIATEEANAEAGTRHHYDAHPLTQAQREEVRKEEEKLRKEEDKELNKTSAEVSKLSSEDINVMALYSINTVLRNTPSLSALTTTAAMNNLVIDDTIIDEINRSITVTKQDLRYLDNFEKAINIANIDKDLKEQYLDNIRTLKAICNAHNNIQETGHGIITLTALKGKIFPDYDAMVQMQNMVNAFSDRLKISNTVDFPISLNYAESNYTSELSKAADIQKQKEELMSDVELERTFYNHRDRINMIIQALKDDVFPTSATGSYSNMLERAIQEVKSSKDLYDEEETALRNHEAVTTPEGEVDLVHGFMKIMKTNAFRQFFGLARLSRNDNRYEGTSLQIRSLDGYYTEQGYEHYTIDLINNTIVLNTNLLPPNTGDHSIHSNYTRLDRFFRANGRLADYILRSMSGTNGVGREFDTTFLRIDARQEYLYRNLHNMPNILRTVNSYIAQENANNRPITGVTAITEDGIRYLLNHPERLTDGIINGYLQPILNAMGSTRPISVADRVYIDNHAGDIFKALSEQLLANTTINSIRNLRNTHSAQNIAPAIQQHFNIINLLSAFNGQVTKRYNTHTDRNYESVNESNLEENIGVINNYSRTIVNDLRQYNEAIRGRPATSDDPNVIPNPDNSMLLSDSEWQTMAKALVLTRRGVPVEFDITNINDFINKHKDIAIKLAKLAQRFINERSINNDYVSATTSRGTQDTVSGTGINTSIEDAIAHSKHATDFQVRRSGPLASDHFKDAYYGHNMDYVDVGHLETFMHEVDKLSKNAGYFSYTKGNMADELFGRRYGTNLIYNEEVVTTMAGIDLAHLTRLSKGQSPEWVKQMVTQKVFTPEASKVFLASGFIDTVTLVNDLGSQIFRELGLSSRGPHVRANAKTELILALGERAFGLVDKGNLIKKRYFNKTTGAVSDTLPTTNQQEWMRVCVLTEEGKKELELINACNNARPGVASTGNGHLLNEIISQNRDQVARTHPEYRREQGRLEAEFNAGVPEDIPYSARIANGRNYQVTEDINSGIVRVNLGAASHPHYVYIARNIAYKKDETRLSYPRLIEIAEHLDEVQEFRVDEFLNEFTPILQGIRNITDLHNRFTNSAERNAVYKLLGLTEPVNGVWGQYQKADNDAMLKKWMDAYAQAEEYRNHQANQIHNGVIDLHYTVTNTINNRQFVDCLRGNYREFKEFRRFFTPRASVYDENTGARTIVRTNNARIRNTLQANIAKTIVLANLGIDTDKAHIDAMGKAYDELFRRNDVLQLLQDVRDHNLSDVQLYARLQQINQNLQTNPVNLVTTKKPTGAGIQFDLDAADKVGEIFEAFRVLARPTNARNNTFMGVSLRDYTGRGALTLRDFTLKIEIDGLTNGTGIHLATSGYIGNTDEYTLEMLCGVGIFPRAFNGRIRDFVTAKIQGGALDSYELTGQTAQTISIDMITEDVSKGIIDNSLSGLFHALSQIYDLPDSSPSTVLSRMFNRNAMKPVLMTNGYGAGKPAIIQHLFNDLSKAINEKTAKMLNANEPLYNLFSILASLNGGSVKLKHIDGSYRTFYANTAANSFSPTDLANCSLFFEDPGNSNLYEVLSKYIFEPAADAANRRTIAAKNHTGAIGQAAKASADVFNLIIANALDGKYSLTELSNLTNADIDKITSDISHVVHIGSDESALDILKDAVQQSIVVAQERLATRVASYYNDGTPGLVISAKSKLTKESIASALSPEFNHTKDSDIINRAQSKIREDLGAFCGIHDAAISGYSQVFNRRNNVGTALNKEFIETTLFSYRPLQEMLKQLKYSQSMLKSNADLDKTNTVLDEVNDAIDKLEKLIIEQVQGKVRLLQNVIAGEPLTIVQYSLSGMTNINITPAEARNYLNEIDRDFQLNNQIDEGTATVKDLKDYIMSHNCPSEIEFYNRVNSFLEAHKSESIRKLLSFLRDPSSGVHSSEDAQRLRDYANNYINYIRGQSTNSFYMSMIDASRTSYAPSQVATNLRELNANTGRGFSSGSPYVALYRLAQLANVYGNMGYAKDKVTGKYDYTKPQPNEAELVREFIKIAPMLSGKLPALSDTYSLLSALTAMFSRTNFTEFNQLNTLMNEALFTPKNASFNLSVLSKNTSTIQVDVDNINLGGLLADFNRRQYEVDGLNLRATPSKKPSVMLGEYLLPYIANMETQIKAMKANNPNAPVQLAFTMQSPLDYMLMCAFNREINSAPLNSTWDGVKLCIVPPITNQADGLVDRNTCIANTIKNYVGNSNYNAYSIFLNNDKKQLEHRNFMYRNKLTEEYIRSGKLSNDRIFTVRQSMLDDIGDTIAADAEQAPRLDSRDTSFIGTGNALGYLHSDFKEANKTIFTEYHIDTGDYAKNAVNNDGYIRNLEGKTDEELRDQIKNSPYSPDTEHSKRVNAATVDWTRHLVDGCKVVIPIKAADYKIDNEMVYHIVQNTPALKQAWERAKKQFNENKRKYDNGVYKYRDSVYTPVEIPEVNLYGTKVTVSFAISQDNEVSVKDLSKYIILDPESAKYHKIAYMIDPDAPDWFKNKFAFNSGEIRDMSITDSAHINAFFRRYYKNNDPHADRKYVAIPDSIANKTIKVTSHVIDKQSTRLAKLNAIDMISYPVTTVYLGIESNMCNLYGSDASVTIDFSSIPITRDNKSAQLKNFNDTITRRNKSKLNTGTSSAHYYNGKPTEDMTDAEYAMFRDIQCNDIEEIANSLNEIDMANGESNSELFDIINKVTRTNAIIRYNLKEEYGRNGSSVLRDINGVKVAYVMHGLTTKGEGSNLEVFAHELAHIPLDFLKLDPSAYNKAVQLYNFVAKNIELTDFEYQDAEDQRIFNYLFRDQNTADPHIEFIVYAVTNKRFKKALGNLNSKKNVNKEFNKTLNSIVNRLSDKLEGKPVKNSSLEHATKVIFNKALSLSKNYYHKHPKVPKEAYAYHTSMLQSVNSSLIKAGTKLLQSIEKGLGVPLNTSYKEFNPDTLKDPEDREQFRKSRPSELLPLFIDHIQEVSQCKNDLSNSLAQSFKGVDKNNWEYVKLRMAAKETVDKARERGAAALNKVVNELLNKVDTKTLNLMPEYVIHSDIQCLFNNRDKAEVYKLLTDKDARYNEIKRLENYLIKDSSMGNYYVNASRGLANKLVHGINTSGIGYNNAYEIANFCGTKYQTVDSKRTSDIDQLTTLYAVHLLSKDKPNYYSQLLSYDNVLDEICNLHSSLIFQEQSVAYGDSPQKYHIPKGDLHGGNVNSRYEVIPEDQLKAYQWVGYKKIKNVDFDTPYKTITKDKFVIVGAKLMPDIPYTDGITVLTDIFNGRNKSDAYIGGTKLDSTNVNPIYNENQLHYLQKFIDDQIVKLNNKNFHQNDYTKVTGVFTPTFGINTIGITGSDFAVNEKDKNKYLGRNFKMTSLLGDHYGYIIENVKAPEWNTKVAEALDEIYKERSKKKEFTWLKEDEENPERNELYKLIPFEVKKYFQDKYPDKGVPVEKAYITGILGYRQASASKVDTEYAKKLKKSTVDYIDHVIHSAPFAYGESLFKYLASKGKENIVIKGITTSLANITSNCVTLGIQGLTPKQVYQYQDEAFKNLIIYNKLNQEYQLLRTKDITSETTPADRARMKALKDAMHANPIAYLAEHGAIPQIAEDLTESDRLTKDMIDKYIPKDFQNILHNFVGDQKSYIYKYLSDLATFGDITAKYALFKHLTEDVRINKDEALRQCVNTFIDYSNPLPKELQYFDSIGMLPFTKFLIGNQTNVVNSLVKNPAGALGWIMANSWMNVSDIYGSILGLDSITNKWHVPGFGLWYDSLSSLPIVKATKFAANVL